MNKRREQGSASRSIATDGEDEGVLQRSTAAWNLTDAPYPASTIQERFEVQADASPEAPAIDFEGGSTSYRELNEQANRLAHRLIGLGVGPEHLVALMMERSPRMIVALLAILKAGGAYVPLDPEVPAERLKFMIEDTGVEILLTDPALEHRLDIPGLRTLGVDDRRLDDRSPAPSPAGNPAPRTTSDHLAYVCYTSGSTGRPKGVAVPHRGVMRLLFGSSFARFGPDESCLQLTPVSFDVSVFEIWGTLLHGGRLVLYPPGKVSVRALAAFLESTPLTTAWLTAGLFHQLVEEAPQSLRGLEQLLAGGDALSAPHVVRALAELDGRPLINGYGPTECTTFATTYTMREAADVGGEIVPIGAPIANTTAHVFDPRAQPVEIGEEGELLLGGVGLARGYFKRPALTAERFIPDAAGARAGERLYRTGDLVSRLPDGRLLFHGRCDHQVKIRGFRIELGEIEAALAAHPDVRSAVVIARAGIAGEKTLIAYLVRRRAELRSDELRRYLASRLPDYMLPATFVFLEALPLNPNGKVDRKALPEPDAARPELGVAFAAPESDTERALAGLWRTLLGLDEVGIDDHFFELGGHSLLIGRLATRARERFEVELSLRDLHAEPTIRAMAKLIDERRQSAEGALQAFERAPRDRPIPLSFPQERVYFLYRVSPENLAYNTQATVRLRGPLRLEVFERVLGEVVRRHVIFRTSFPEIDGEPMQVVLDAPTIELPLIDLSALAPADRQGLVEGLKSVWFDRPYDLLEAPLARWAMLRFSAQDHLLLQSEHHFVHDGWSLSQLLTEYEVLYQAMVEGRPLPPDPEIQFIDYAWWQRTTMRGETLAEYLEFWTGMLDGYCDNHDLPLDRPRPKVHRFRGRALRFHLDLDLCRRLRAFSRESGITLFTTMLSAFATLLHRYGGQDDLLIGSAVAARNRREFERMIGMVVKTLVLRADLRGRPTFTTLLGRLREYCMKAFAYQEVPLDKLVEALEPERDLARNPLFQTMFSFHDSAMPDLEFCGLSGEVTICHNGSSKIDMNIIVIPRAEQRVGRRPKAGEEDIEILWEYSTDLFDECTVRRMIGHFLTVLEAVVATPESRVEELPVMTRPERHQVLREWQSPAPPAGGDLWRLVAGQMRATPEAIAIAWQDEGGEDRLSSYGGLLQRSAGLAAALRGLGVTAESRVGLCAARSPRLIEAMLAILAAGGAYVALDPSYPRARLAAILDDAAAGSEAPVVCEEGFAGLLPERARVLLLDRPSSWPQSDGGDRSPVDPRQLAYVLFTSGSTGRPKGVAIEHRSAVALVRWAQQTYDRAELARVLASTSINFDLSVFEIFVTLSTGGTVVLVENALALSAGRGPATRPTLVNTVPSAMAEWLRADALPATVRTVNLAGEPLRPALVTEICRQTSVRRVLDLYGPSEDTTYSTAGERRAGGVETIGRPLAGTRARVLDRALRPVAAGIVGEIGLAGAGLARGYLHQPRLTATSFVPEPDAASPGARLYRTGDLGRWLADGRLAFVGRRDHQVKVRGFRIELGEIERALLVHPEVGEAVVGTHASGADARLVAWWTPARGAALSSDALAAFLGRTLPAYMVPAVYARLEELPRTPTGKVDRKALPEPGRPVRSGRESADRTPVQELLAGLWSEILGVPEIGLDDNFFHLGGHSLLATRVLARLRRIFDLELDLPALFGGPTVRELAGVVEERLAATGTEGRGPALEPVPRDRELPASFAQEQLWSIDQLEPGHPLYHVPLKLRLRGEPDLDALRSSLSALEVRHEALRTTFRASGSGGSAVEQQVHPPQAVDLPVVDLSPLGDVERRAEDRLLAEARRPFDLARGPLWRAALLRLEPRHHVLMIVLHHIVADGWSIGVLLRELETLYRGYVRGGQGDPPPDLPVQPADHAVWQRRRLEDGLLDRALAYWLEQLAAPPTLELPTDRQRSARRGRAGDLVRFTLPRELGSAVEALARQHGATLFMTLLAAFDTLLYRHTGQRDLALGAPVAGRQRLELEPLIGFFVNTVVLRTRVESRAGFDDLLRRLRDTVLRAWAHQEVPFEKLVEALAPDRRLGQNPLFQVMFALEHEPNRAPDLAGLDAEFELLHNKTAKFALSLTAIRRRDGLTGYFEYDADLFDRTSVERLAARFDRLLAAVVDDPERALDEVPLLAAAELAQLGREWNDTAVAVPEPSTLHQTFSVGAEGHPERTAIVDGERHLSYRALDRRSNRLARRLRDAGVGPEVFVGLQGERSIETLVALFAILKAGGAPLPLDPQVPETRQRYMLRDAGAELVVGTAASPGARTLDPSTSARGFSDRPLEPPRSGHPAYLLYTSGSTGEPKGVVVSHRAALHFVRQARRGYALGGDDRVLQFASLSFDTSVEEIHTTLTGGATLVLRDELSTVETFFAMATRQRITVLDLPTAFWHEICLALDDGLDLPAAVRLTILGGEAARAGALRTWRRRAGGRSRLLNTYGPTEATVVATWTALDGEGGVGEVGVGEDGAPPIGRPLPGVEALVLGRDLRPVPLGVFGELGLGGRALARGYLGRAAITARHFVPHPLTARPGARLYRTGDRARWLADGRLEFGGRIDQQIKIRGFRVELGEVENALARHPQIVECAVLTRLDGEHPQLVAWLAPRPGAAPGQRELSTFLGHTLPPYMIPARFGLLEALPRLASGKVDRVALERRELPHAEGAAAGTLGELEAVVIGIWAEVLGEGRTIGLHDSFFDLGGHSLLATRLLARLRQTFEVDLALATLFEHPTPQGLAAAIVAGLRGDSAEAGRRRPPLAPHHGTEPVLSFAQERLWFIDQLLERRHAYNVPVALELAGRLDVAALEAALREILRRHQSLRTTIEDRGGRPHAVLRPVPAEVLRRVDLSAAREADLERPDLERLSAIVARRPFDLAADVLLRALLIERAPEEHRLILTLHHVAADGWSVGILVRELARHYDTFTGERPPLDEPRWQVADHAAWQRGWLDGTEIEAQLAFWRRQLDGAPDQLDLPVDRPRPAVKSYRGAEVTRPLEPELLARVRALAQRTRTTPFMVLLAAFEALLARHARQHDLCIGTPVAGRQLAEVEDLIGLFVNTLVLRARPLPHQTFSQRLSAVRRRVLAALAHQELPFERLVDELAPRRSLAQTPLFQVLFAFAPTAATAAVQSAGGLRATPLPSPVETAKVDLALSCEGAGEDRLRAALVYDPDLFDRTTVGRLLDHWQRLLELATADPEQPLAALGLLSQAQRHQLLYEFAACSHPGSPHPPGPPLNGWRGGKEGRKAGRIPSWLPSRRSSSPSPAMERGPEGEETLHDTVWTQATRTPDAVALVRPRWPEDDLHLTYRALVTGAARLAGELRRRGVERGARVALCAGRSPEMVQAMLAVLAAGGAYVALDPEWPRQRLAMILDDAGEDGARLAVIAERRLSGRLPAATGADQVLWLDRTATLPAASPSSLPAVDAGDAAYVLYTSGSTGKPKGVVIEHRSVVALLGWTRDAFAQREIERVLAATSINFDLSIFELFTPLGRGGSVVLVDDALALAEPATRAAARPSLVNTVPSAITEVLRLGALPASVRTVNLAGEALRPALVDRLYEQPGVERVVDLYGPSEDTTYSTWSVRRRGGVETIGRPVAGSRAYVLDPALDPLPLGVAGELHLAGSGLARGYLARPRLTAERFVPEPFAAAPGARMYRTGDRVRWLAGGDLQFLGRFDHQVKVRGYRIELGEIETVLLQHPAVSEALAVADGDRLIAHCVVSDPAAAPELQRHLAASLPAYMVPQIVLHPALPRLPNGKVDRAALLRLTPARAATGARAPESPEEAWIAGQLAALLDLEAIDPEADFFALGGHSLLATRLLARIRSRLGIDLGLRTLFEEPTAAALARAARRARQTLPADQEPLTAQPDAERPLSFAQERLWFLDQLMDAGSAYNLPFPLQLAGPLDPAALAAALGAVADRHETLQATFPAHGGRPRLHLVRSEIGLPIVDLSGLDPGARAGEARRLRAGDARRSFDLAHGPLWRATLLRLGAQRHDLLLTLHHIVADGWSLDLLEDELSAFYRAAHRGERPALEPLAIAYPDFARWQRRWLGGEVLDTQLGYWRRALAGAPTLLDLPLDRPRPAVQGHRGAVASRSVEAVSAPLQQLARDAAVTPFMLHLALWQLLLARHSGQRDLAFGTPVAGRRHAESEGLIGLFVNTLVLRGQPRPRQRLTDVLAATRERVFDAFAHQDLPFEKLAAELEPERSLSHAPLFQVLFLQPPPRRSEPWTPELAVRRLEVDTGSTKFDLTLVVGDRDGVLRCTVEYDRDLFDRTTILRLLEHWRNAVHSLVQDPRHDGDRRLEDIGWLSAAERQRLLREETPVTAAVEAATVHGLVAARAGQRPDAIAVVACAADGSETALSYRTLDRRAGRLAAVLRERGAGLETRVGLCAGRTPDLPLAMLAVLKTGAAYVALDPSYPAARLAQIVDDLGPHALVLAERRFIARLPAGGAERAVWLDDPLPGRTPTGDASDAPHQAAYLLYTSGSTGRPKGVVIEHRSVLALLGWTAERVFEDGRAVQVVGDGEAGGLLAATSINFDLSVFELFTPLARGGTAVLVDSVLALAEPDQRLLARRVRLINTVPSAIAELLRLEALPAGARSVFLAGEPLRRELVARLHEQNTVERVVDLYGPSEDTTYSTWAPRRPGSPETIGRPIAGTRAQVLDASGGVLPFGVAGELCLAGAGLARGYLGQPARTAERFVPDPHGSQPGERMYRTGDRARRLADGRLQFLGRDDHQVKVRGFRIELGEIETHLLAQPGVREAVVQATATRDALVAHLLDDAPANDALGRSLARALPGYMVPTRFVRHREMPRLPNGKLDRAALARLAEHGRRAGAGSADGDRAPVNAAEEMLLTAWSELLEVERIGLGESFFALGGHSLLATRVLARVRSRFGVELPLRALFEQPTIAGLARRILETLGSGEAVPTLPPARRSSGRRTPLSFSQERLWFLDRLEPRSSAYNIPLALRLRGALDPAALAASFDLLRRRHEILRTTFAGDRGEPYQIVHPPRPKPLPVIDLAALVGKAGERQMERWGRAEGEQPFDLERGPLLRCRLLRLAPEDHVLLVTAHHIVGDGWSMRVLLDELSESYAAALSGRPAVLPRLEIQYGDHAAWQRLDESGFGESIRYWRRQLEGAPTFLELPTDRPRPAVLSAHGADHPQRLSPALSAAVRELAQRHGVTPFMVFLGLLGLQLGRYSGARDLLIGAPVAGRDRLELEPLIGFFLNNLVLRLDLTGRPRLAELIDRVAQTVLGAHAHQALPFEKLVEELQPERALDHHPLYQVMLNLHNFALPRQATARLGDLEGERLELYEPQAKLDLNLHVTDRDGGFELYWVYSRDLFDRSTVARMAGHLAVLIERAAADDERPVDALLHLSAGEEHQALVEWNDTAAAEPADELLQSGFERQVMRRPGAIALLFGDHHLSYRELDRRAGLVAHRLRGNGVEVENRVGLFVDRSLEMVIALLGILEAGGAYVPLDPQLPPQRLTLMLEDARARGLLSRAADADRLPDFAGSTWLVDELVSGERVPGAAPSRPGVRGENLAYVIYTSGTTGRPKGVMCRHRGAAAYLRFMLDAFALTPADRTLQLASLAFDPSVREIFGPLSAGASVVLVAPEQRREPAALLDLLVRERLTAMLSVVPSLLRTLPGAARGDARFPALRTLMANGERLFLSDVRAARRLFGEDLEIVNQYGPTECTMVACFDRSSSEQDRQVALLGRPIPGKRVHLVDADGRPVMLGQVGEILIAGDDLGRGYLDRPAQTAASFQPDPHGLPGGRRYASGDLGRCLRDGRIEFVGRRDHQVKVRGQRVEAGEIEAALQAVPGVSMAAVSARETSPGEVQLIAHLEVGGEKPAVDELRRHLLATLPEAMIPARWSFLDRMPLNPNGKIDRRALPEPQDGAGREASRTAPRTRVERLLARLWGELLALDQIGIEENFFDLGGHSLHGVRALYRLQELLGVDIEARALFEAQTVAELAPRVEQALLDQLQALSEEAAWKRLEQLDPDAAIALVEKPEDDAVHLEPGQARQLLTLPAVHREVRALRLQQAIASSNRENAIPRRADRRRAPLSWIQEAFWFIEQQEDTQSVYRSSHRVTLRGALDLAVLQGALATMVERHEILRTRFDVDDEGRTYQEVLPRLALELPVVDLQHLAGDDREAAARRALHARESGRFDLTRPPLWRMLVICLEPETAHLLLAMHHIITDNWSMGAIFFQELSALYTDLASGRRSSLPELDVQYADYAQWERDRLQDETLERLMGYWGERLAGGIPTLELRSDRPRPEVPSYRGAMFNFALPKELTERLEARSRAENVSPFMMLLAAYKVLLSLYSGQHDIAVASPSANRARIQTERLLGCFANMLLLRTDLSGRPTLRQILNRVKETALGAVAHQEMPFMLLLAHHPPKDFNYDRSPFQASLTFLNAPGAMPSFSGLAMEDWRGVDRRTTDQDLALWMSRSDTLYGTLVYSRDLFDEDTVAALMSDLQQILTLFCDRPQRHLGSLEELRAATIEV